MTSGTNGIPKAVVRKEAAVWSEVVAKSAALHLTRKDRVFILPPVYHAYCHGTAFGALMTGAQIHLVKEFVPINALHYISKNQLQFFTLFRLCTMCSLKKCNCEKT